MEDGQTHRVALSSQNQGEGRRQLPTEPKLGWEVLGRTPIHRLAHIEQEVRAQVGLFLKLLYVEAVGTGEHPPIEEP